VQLLVLLAADYANVTREGKPNVMGVFSNIRAEHFPARHPEMHVVISLAASPAEYGTRRTLRLKLINEDGSLTLVEGSQMMEIPEGGGGRRMELTRIFRLRDIVFPSPGDYQISVLVDNDEKGSLPLIVSKVEAESRGGAAS